MAIKTKCPSCEAEIEIPDDPRVGELKELIEQQGRVISEMSDRLKRAGEPVPPSVPKVKEKEKKTRKRYEGAFFDDDTEEERDDGEDED